MEKQRFSYDNKITKAFTIATIIWGVVGILVGLLAAMQMAFPALNFNLEFTTFGRVRPLHTNAIIFAFVGNAIYAAVYYSLQRLCKARMFSDLLSWINFWGWQLIIVLAAVSLLAGYSTGNEYAELEWWLDIIITLVWVVFGINLFGTIIKRRVDHLYVAIWFYIATWIAIAVLHIARSISIPYSWLESYPAYAGVQDALVQWWYGHNAVGFFLTTSFLGLMYYFLPKAANRPIYSYKLSVIHFWSLVFLYVWTGPHHLLYTTLPAWIQSLGVVFSVMLIAPSWGGMFNGLLTLRGAWDKVRESAVLKFFVVGVTAYGLATFEGPMLALKWVNGITHFTDWIIAHVHVGGMGWNGCMTFGMLYFLVPRLFKTKLFSNKLANIHFWLATLGIIVYVIPLYIGSIVQALKLKEFNDEGMLANPSFLDTLLDIMPMYHARIIGGALFFVGALLMVYNLVKTMKAGSFEKDEEVEAPSRAFILKEQKVYSDNKGHRWLERRGMGILLVSLLVIIVGTVFELVPVHLIQKNEKAVTTVKPYSPLEIEGRDIYIKEGCNTCHSQMVRPLRSETERYGEYSKSDEYYYAYPHLWGSRRTGPDLARGGIKGSPLYKPATWHYLHMADPQKTVPGSIMPAYPWLLTKDVDFDGLKAKIKTLQFLNVPYKKGFEDQAADVAKQQAKAIADELNADPNIQVESNKEIVALIAYLHRLGNDITPKTADAK